MICHPIDQLLLLILGFFLQKDYILPIIDENDIEDGLMTEHPGFSTPGHSPDSLRSGGDIFGKGSEDRDIGLAHLPALVFDQFGE